jgi:alkylation response protein AidB-like acyl-CoA dehydrogenase
LNFDLSEDHQQVEKAVRDAMLPWTKRRAELREMTKRAELPEELWKDFAELGLLGCLIPEEYGGNGFTEEYGFLDLYNGARLLKTAPVSREMILNFVSEWDLGLPKSY